LALDGGAAVSGHATPEAAWEAFAAAIAARDEGAARRAATDGAWAGRGDSVAMVYQSAVEDGFRLAATGPAWIDGDRAVLPAAIEREGRSASLFALLERRGGAWGVSAGVREERQASLFLAVALPAVVEVPELGPSPEAERWARDQAAATGAAGAAAEIVGVHALPARGRAVVGLRRTEGGRPVEEWVCLDTGGDAPRELGRSSYPSLGLLLTGVSAALPARAAQAAAGAAGVAGTGASAAGAGAGAADWKAVNALLQGLTELAREAPASTSASASGAPAPLPEALTQAIAGALETSGRPAEAAALQQQVAAQKAGAEAGGATPHAPDALDPLRAALRREIDAFRAEKGIAAETSLLDAAFMAEHGQELSTRLLRVLAGGLPPLQGTPAAGPGPSS
jgi:hypothetical protein